LLLRQPGAVLRGSSLLDLDELLLPLGGEASLLHVDTPIALRTPYRRRVKWLLDTAALRPPGLRALLRLLGGLLLMVVPLLLVLLLFVLVILLFVSMVLRARQAGNAGEGKRADDEDGAPERKKSHVFPPDAPKEQPMAA
jgi:hypothetical protein